MKLFIAGIAIFLVMACEVINTKVVTEEEFSQVFDTIEIYDTIKFKDSIQIIDTLQYIETEVHIDSLFHFDTFQIIDTLHHLETELHIDSLFHFDTIQIYDTTIHIDTVLQYESVDVSNLVNLSFNPFLEAKSVSYNTKVNYSDYNYSINCDHNSVYKINDKGVSGDTLSFNVIFEYKGSCTEDFKNNVTITEDDIINTQKCFITNKKLKCKDENDNSKGLGPKDLLYYDRNNITYTDSLNREFINGKAQSENAYYVQDSGLVQYSLGLGQPYPFEHDSIVDTLFTGWDRTILIGIDY